MAPPPPPLLPPQVLKTYDYKEIPTWGSSKTSFVLHIGNLLKQEKTYFATPNDAQGDDMNAMVRNYVTHLHLSEGDKKGAAGGGGGGGGP